MKTFRTVLFWLHLAAGLLTGLFIGIMCLTGTVLAFEQEIVAWAERDARRIAPPSASVPRLSLDELQRLARVVDPAFNPTTVTVQRDPAAAITLSAGRDRTVYAHPHTGAIRPPASSTVRDFMQLNLVWHRYLAREGDQRPTGKLVNGIANLVFCALAITGLYLWWPRTLTWRGVRAVALLNWRLTGRTRDFNWHNAIGLWTAPVLVVLTLTAVPISFRWGGDLIVKLAGDNAPAPSTATSTPAAPAPAADISSASQESLFVRVRDQFPDWSQITLRAPTGPSRDTAPTGPAPFTAIVRETGSWPKTATTTLTLDPVSGNILSRNGYADLSPARRIRSWTRFLHTGQAVGWPGQLVAGLACLGGCFLVYTGFALSYRRFFVKDRPRNATATAATSRV